MIETVEELIEVYSLDKEIKDTHPIYRDFAIQLFAIYNLINLRLRLLPIPKDEVKPNNVNIVENKPVEVKPIENKTVENKVIKQPSNIQNPAGIKNKPFAEVKKEPTVNNTNSKNENAKGNPTINNRTTERTTTINIVQNAYVNGRKVSSADGEEDTNSNGCSAINNININFGNYD